MTAHAHESLFNQSGELSTEEEQEQYLAEAFKTVKVAALNMKRALDRNDLREALKFSAQMLSELRTSVLSPVNYYGLWIKVGDELSFLEQYFTEQVGRGKKIEEFYEVVQHAGNIIPRLYLLITVGIVYIRTKKAPSKDILKDLVEMCKGVQNPTRGLFLRNYLSKNVKNMLPDTGNEYEGIGGGTVRDSVDFVCQNFSEMVRLWIRLQQKLTDKRRQEKREKDRKELRVLVGFNLERLAQLEGVDIDLYTTEVFPRVMEIIVKCEDVLAQQYLMDTVVAAFTDDFHLQTLEDYLKGCLLLQLGVDLNAILTDLMNRLSAYAVDVRSGTIQSRNKEEEQTAIDGMFRLFLGYIGTIAKERKGAFTSAGFVDTMIALANLAMNAYSGDMDKVDKVFQAVLGCFSPGPEESPPLLNLDSDAVKKIKKLLMTPITELKSVMKCLVLEHLPPLLNILDFKPRRAVALDIARALVQHAEPIEDPEDCATVFTFISPLVIEDEGLPPFSERYEDDEAFVEEQVLVTRIVHLVRNSDPAILFKMLAFLRKQFGQGGTKRIVHTLPPLIFAYLRLAHQVKEEDLETYSKLLDKVFDHLQSCGTVLCKEDSELAYKLYLQCALAADSRHREALVYEFVTRAFTIFEEEMPDSKQQLAALTLMISSLQATSNVGEENYGNMCIQATKACSRMLKKKDQCTLVALCSTLFWKGADHAQSDQAQMIKCLLQALKIIDKCVNRADQIPLYMEIVNRFIYYYSDKNVTKVTPDQISFLLGQINSSLDEYKAEIEAMTDDQTKTSMMQYYENTQQYVRTMQTEDPEHWSVIDPDRPSP
eukprot:NODE_138_length_2643_cov_38.976870_g111_i0.p1 GENE.NODE_138_length_2643_cov_38.976870_g111_i0~~NODE_138_length_2643_cov_38.976870_g111_i0.p1  ORF type:complete len:823 (-),score=314.76 NODE_138_length_2643_cov_38.976870_g111_i0:108-2576(-)